MAKPSPFTVDVFEDPHRPGRYHWSVHRYGNLYEKSGHSFATKVAARYDAERFVDNQIKPLGDISREDRQFWTAVLVAACLLALCAGFLLDHFYGPPPGAN